MELTYDRHGRRHNSFQELPGHHGTGPREQTLKIWSSGPGIERQGRRSPSARAAHGRPQELGPKEQAGPQGLQCWKVLFQTDAQTDGV